MEKLEIFLKNHTSLKRLILYMLFGGLTTLVNWAAFFTLYNALGMNKYLGQVIAWILAVAFAYVTNRRFVFHSDVTGEAAVMQEALRFAAGRLASFGVETALLALGTDVLGYDTNLVKIVASVASIVLNYVFSKWLVFRNGEEPHDERHEV